MKLISLVFLFCLTQVLTFGQQRVAKIVDFDALPQEGYDLFTIGNNIYLVYLGVCFQTNSQNLVSCTGLIKMDQNLNFVKSIIIPDLGIGKHTVAADTLTNTIKLIGSRYDIVNDCKSYVAYDIDCEKMDFSVDVLDLKIPKDTTSEFFHRHTNIFNKKYVLSGHKFKNNTTDTQIYVLDKEHRLDTMLEISINTSASNWETINGRNNTLLLSILNQRPKDAFHIIRLDSLYKEVWRFVLPVEDAVVKPFFTELLNENIVLCREREVTISMQLLSVSPNKSIAWEYNFDDKSGKLDWLIFKLKTLKNGDFLVMGSHTDFTTIKEIELASVPYIARFNAMGKKLWEKSFYRTVPVLDYCIGHIRNAVELDNGDILAVGAMYNYLEYDSITKQGRSDEDILLIRMNSLGCIDEKCENFTNITPKTTKTINSDISAQIDVSPNPAYDVLNVVLTGKAEGLNKFNILDMTGKQWMTGDIQGLKHVIEIQSLHNGVYMIQLTDGKQSVTKKIVKM